MNHVDKTNQKSVHDLGFSGRQGGRAEGHDNLPWLAARPISIESKKKFVKLRANERTSVRAVGGEVNYFRWHGLFGEAQESGAPRFLSKSAAVFEVTTYGRFSGDHGGE